MCAGKVAAWLGSLPKATALQASAAGHKSNIRESSQQGGGGGARSGWLGMTKGIVFAPAASSEQAAGDVPAWGWLCAGCRREISTLKVQSQAPGWCKHTQLF